jgi:hypothetical protein
VSQLNIVAIAGKIERKFDEGTTKNDTEYQSALLEHDTGRERPDKFWLSAMGEYPMRDMRAVGVGDEVIVQGRLKETVYKDKNDEWVRKVEIAVQKIQRVGVTEGSDSPADESPEYEPAAEPDNPDGLPF